MKTGGIKVFVTGLIVFLVTVILNWYTTIIQFHNYVITDTHIIHLAEVKMHAYIDLFAQVFSVIGMLIAVQGVLMLLKAQKQVELKPSQF